MKLLIALVAGLALLAAPAFMTVPVLASNPDFDDDPFAIWYTLAELDLQTGDRSETLAALDGTEVRIPGFVVPTEFDGGGELTEFVLVPAFGYCIHVPPPPPNQMIYVTMPERTTFTDIWLPVMIEGTLTISEVASEFGAVSYQIEGEITGRYTGYMF